LERLFNVGLEELHGGGQFWYSHKTDLYRVWILERFGGVYLDTDVILQKPIKTSVFGPHVLGLEQGSLQPEKSHEAVVVNSTHVQSLDDNGVYESTHGQCYDGMRLTPMQLRSCYSSPARRSPAAACASSRGGTASPCGAASAHGCVRRA